MRWNDFDSNEAVDADYGEVGPTMRAFEQWVEAFVAEHGGYSPLGQAYEEDFISLGEESIHSVGANRYIEMVADNIDIHYDYPTTLPTIKKVLDHITKSSGAWEKLIEEAEDYFCSCDDYAFTDESCYEE
jgi:hypothetical protein